MPQTQLKPIAPALLGWYYTHRRSLPFRENPLPYAVWVSEVMLQQTRVAAVLPYYERFMKQLPTVAALAACGEEHLHKLWEGLGYYSRARNLQKAARLVMEQHGGELPGSFEALRALPGIGDYTAGAIASICFGLPVVAVDGNVLRVFSRLLADNADVMRPDVKRDFSAQVAQQQPPDTPGDFNQALMELGALVCVPKKPQCGVCPLAEMCAANRLDIAASLPYKTPKKPKTEIPVCVLVVRQQNKVLLHKRPATGLLAGLWEPLTREGRFSKQDADAWLQALLPGARLRETLPPASHIFTHRVWRMYGWVAEAPGEALPGAGYCFATPGQLDKIYTLPGAFSAYRNTMQGNICRETDTK